MYTLEQMAWIAAVGSTFVGVGALIKGVAEYSRHNSIKRVELFFEMRRRLKDDPRLSRVVQLIRKRDLEGVDGLELEDKLYFTGFFEEVALLLNSGLIRPQVANYMFGYYMLDCWNFDYFWEGLNKNTKHWAVLRDFVVQMEAERERLKRPRRRYRL